MRNRTDYLGSAAPAAKRQQTDVVRRRGIAAKSDMQLPAKTFLLKQYAQEKAEPVPHCVPQQVL